MRLVSWLLPGLCLVCSAHAQSLFDYAALADTAAVRQLLDQDLDPNQTTAEGFTPLHFAVRNGSLETVQLLLEHGADPDQTCIFGTTPLQWATPVGTPQLLLELLERSDDVNAACANGLRAIDFARQWGRDELVTILLEHGANTTSPPSLSWNGPYLGQPSPGIEPVVFLPEVFSVPFRAHGPLLFSRDGRELIWAQHAQPIEGLWTSHATENGWTSPATIPFSLEHGERFPQLSPEGDRLYYFRDLDSEGEGSTIYYRNRIPGGWGSESSLLIEGATGESVVPGGISDDRRMYLYSSGLEPSRGESDIYWVSLDDDVPLVPHPLPASINSGQQDIEPTISTDGNTLVFASTREGRPVLYVSFRDEQENWTEAARLPGSINQPGIGCWRAFLTRDGKYLFYQTGGFGGERYYWVSTQFLASVR